MQFGESSTDRSIADSAVLNGRPGYRFGAIRNRADRCRIDSVDESSIKIWACSGGRERIAAEQFRPIEVQAIAWVSLQLSTKRFLFGTSRPETLAKKLPIESDYLSFFLYKF